MRLILSYTAALFLATVPALAQEVQNAPGGILRALDKTSGQTTDFEMQAGTSISIGNLTVVLSECRYPRGNPSGNAYAAVEVSEVGKTGVVFSGWMIASAPAISAMEHPRYDVWVMRCITS